MFRLPSMPEDTAISPLMTIDSADSLWLPSSPKIWPSKKFAMNTFPDSSPDTTMGFDSWRAKHYIGVSWYF